MNARRTSQITLISGLLLILALFLNFSNLYYYRQIILVVATIIAGYPIALRAIQSIRMKAYFSIQLLVTIAVVGALFIGEYVESAVVTFLFLFGAYLEARTLEKTRSSLKSLIDMAPSEATVLQDGELKTVDVYDIEKDDQVIIRSGEKVAVDGQIVKGTATLSEAAITGESVPATKTIKDSVFSGTIVDHGYIEVIADRVGDDTTFSKIIELVEEAQETKSKTEKFLDRFAAVYTPAILILSVLVYIFSQNINMTLTFLVVACPGALVLSAPVSIVAGIGNGARNGALIKGGEMMEKLAKMDTVVFDKTGTLTEGHPAVTDIHSFGIDEQQLLTLVAEAELISEHHLGQTIVKEAQEQGIDLTNLATETKVVKGQGIKAAVDGQQVIVGNRQLMKVNEITINERAEAYAVTKEQLGNTAVFAAIDGKLSGIISIADKIRQEAKAAILELRKNGVKQIIMLTGDNRHTANLVGEQLGLDAVYAELLPEDKVTYIQKLQSDNHYVGMVGDGINDAPAIAMADIGLAMGTGGTDVSMETADIVLMADRLDQFSHAYGLAKATTSNMRQNTFFAVGTVILLLIGVLLGQVFLATGMLIHELSIILVVLNALRLVKYKSSRQQSTQGELIISS